MIRVLVADDHPIFREGLRKILDSAGDIQVIAEASSGGETMDRVRLDHPDVVLLDMVMPGQDGLETIKSLKRLSPKVHVVMLTVHPEDHFAVRCLKEGADGYLTKDAGPHALLDAVRRVHRGGKYITPTLAERLALNVGHAVEGAAHENLSARELEVLRRIGSGKSVGEIAAEMHLSVKTVSTYRSRILEKMSLRSNGEMIRYALESGLTD